MRMTRSNVDPDRTDEITNTGEGTSRLLAGAFATGFGARCARRVDDRTNLRARLAVLYNRGWRASRALISPRNCGDVMKLPRLPRLFTNVTVKGW